MKHAKKTSVEFFDPTPQVEGSTITFSDPIFGVVIQDNFTSSEERDEFMQAITTNGVTFLRCAATPLAKPTTDDLNLLEKLSRVLNGIWAASDERRCCNDA